jgi:protein-disulfide isomerase
MLKFVKDNPTIAIIGTVAVIALLIAGGALLLSNNAQTTASSLDRYANVAQGRLSDGGFVLGNPEAPITVIEFGDFACPHCQEYFTQTERFIDEYVITGKARFEYRMFISGADPTYGPYTARLAECAAEQRDGAFWPSHDILFTIGRTQQRFNDRIARTLADRLELNFTDLINCAEDADQVEFDVSMGQRLNVQSTPTIMIRIGNTAPQYLSDGVVTYDRGGVPYEVLQAVVERSQ